ncbi:MAG: hypothetical protein ACREIS_06205 [Nitrospiraceae bacterium]
MNQRRRLLNLARKGDPKAIKRLFELYQVRVYTGEALSKTGRLPQWPTVHQNVQKSTPRKRATRRSIRTSRRVARRRVPARRVAARKSTRKASRR